MNIVLNKIFSHHEYKHQVLLFQAVRGEVHERRSGQQRHQIVGQMGGIWRSTAKSNAKKCRQVVLHCVQIAAKRKVNDQRLILLRD